MELAVAAAVVDVPPLQVVEDDLITTAPVRQVIGPTIDLEKVIAAIEQCSTMEGRLLGAARGYPWWVEAKTSSGSRCARLYADLLALYHGTVLTAEEIYLANTLADWAVGTSVSYPPDVFGPELTQFHRQDLVSWDGPTFAGWRDEVLTRSAALGLTAATGTRFI